MLYYAVVHIVVVMTPARTTRPPSAASGTTGASTTGQVPQVPVQQEDHPRRPQEG